jgi:AraC family transcriptional regulator of adaptative response/methylated-DNA-[protein]-cysteine methyltransferase
MTAISSDEAIARVEFIDAPARASVTETRVNRGPAHRESDRVQETESAILLTLRRQLDEYFAGLRREFTVPTIVDGSEFERKAWSYLRSIPFAQTRSYGQQARAIGTPAAVRAVGRANGRNQIAILIPCHRVIGANGSLIGYGGGIDRKQWLLEHERRVVADDPRAGMPPFMQLGAEA